MKYYPPTFEDKQFNCIYCNVYSSQTWHLLLYRNIAGSLRNAYIHVCICGHCEKKSYWFNKKMVVPSAVLVEPPHEDIPEECIDDFEESREVFSSSPRASAALLRLLIQKLMVHLGEKGRNINEDIKSLVQKGLPVEVQQALDYCRVIGNHAVHPGEIDLNDTSEIAKSLFSMINFIVDNQITNKKKIASLYGKLPESALEAINKRDGDG